MNKNKIYHIDIHEANLQCLRFDLCLDVLKFKLGFTKCVNNNWVKVN